MRVNTTANMGGRYACMAAAVVAASCWLCRGQECGTLDQVQACREDCGSCAASPCCALEWDLPSTSAMSFAQMILAMGSSGGPDTLFKLQGHVANYGNWSFDIYDDPPRKIQLVHVPPEWAASNFGIGVNRVDEISLSIYDSSSSSSRVVAFSRSSPASVEFQCDGGSNYQGLITLILNSGVSSFRQRTLYGCFEQPLGTTPSHP